MKNLSLFVSVFALFASTSYAAIDCGTLPSCESLGYVDKIAQCPSMASPAGRNGSNITYQRQYITCPFDTTKGKCLHPAAVGQIGYFTAYPGRGWILCDGQAVSKTKYPQLANLLGDKFGSSSSTFNVPDYRGFFLRVLGAPSSTYGKTGNYSLTSPQQEGLPNITGTGGYYENVKSANDRTPSGAFYLTSVSTYKGVGDSDGDNPILNFNASKSNPIYGAQSGVTPPNMAVYAYIYAGLTVE